MSKEIEWIAGRYLLAILFVAGAVQKVADPRPAQALLTGYGLSEWLVWPALLFNASAACVLITGKFLKTVGRALALYCVVTSVFPFVPSDPWQMSIMIKNWAIAGGCLILAASSDQET